MTDLHLTDAAYAADYSNGASAVLDELLADLNTYRYVPQVPVTPGLARRLIELNSENNRNLKLRVVETLTRDMTRGAWRTRTGQNAKIGTDGRLLDGNHRMHAVVDSGKTILMDLVFGIDPDDIIVIDAHKTRSAMDVLKVSTGIDLSAVASVVKRIIGWERGYFYGTSGQTTASATELHERYNRTPGLFDAAARRGRDLSHRNLGTPAICGTAYYLFATLDKEAADDFFDLLVSGLGLERRTAIYQLRERMIRRRFDRLGVAEMLALYVRAWNRDNTFVNGNREVVTNLLVSRNELTNANFPQPKKPTR